MGEFTDTVGRSSVSRTFMCYKCSSPIITAADAIPCALCSKFIHGFSCFFVWDSQNPVYHICSECSLKIRNNDPSMHIKYQNEIEIIRKEAVKKINEEQQNSNVLRGELDSLKKEHEDFKRRMLLQEVTE